MKLMARPKQISPPGKALQLERFLPYRLSVLSNRISRAIAARYAEAFDLTIPEWRVMAVLGRSPGITAKAIAEATEMDKVAVSRAIARLAQARRVLTKTDAEDARRQLLSLSSQGEALYARIAPMALQAEEHLLAALSSSEREQLDVILGRLMETARRL